MTFFKIIQNNTVIDVGNVFLRWNKKRNRFYICDVNEAEFAQSSDQTKIYKDYWLKASPVEAEDASIVVIDRDQYDEIRALLEDGQQIEIPPEPPKDVPEQRPSTKLEEEKPLTISEMRQMIKEQQEQILILKDKIQEMSNALL